ncbi:MAG: hypothetical protein Q4A44_05260 [Bacteroidales bacterium]|nr:hypothetical protein [Bacteroidales bacterium]
MRTYKYNLGGQEFVIRLSDSGRRIAGVALDGKPIGVSEADMPRYAAVIALALLKYEVDDIHDDESDIITFDDDESPWSAPAQLHTAVG